MSSYNKQQSCVIYARQSSGKESESESVTMQIRKCRALAEKQKLTVIGVFQDHNASGRLYPAGAETIERHDEVFHRWFSQQTAEKRYRQGLGDMLKMIHRVKYVIVDDLTRLARPLSGSFLNDYLKQRLQFAGIVILTVKNGEVDYANYMDCLVSDVQTHVVDNQLKIQTQKAKDAMMELKKNGYYPNQPKMFGIEYIGGKERAVRVIPECAAVIRLIYRRILEMTPCNRIIRELNTEHRHLFRTVCYPSTFRHIVSQPFYAGYMYGPDGELIPARQMQGKEIVSCEEWKQVQDIMEERKTHQCRVRCRELPFSGLLFCGNCGSRLVMGNDHGKIYYFCRRGSVVSPDPACRASRINITLVRENGIYTGLQNALAPLLLLAQCRKQAEWEEAEYRYRELDKRINTLALREQRFAELSATFAESKLDPAEYALILRNVYRPIQRLKEEIAEIRMQEKEHRTREQIMAGSYLTAKQVRQHRIPESLYRKLLHETVKKITVYYDNILIETFAGTFTLPRLIRGRFRNMPVFHLRESQDNPSDPGTRSWRLTYVYNPRGVSKRVFFLVPFSIFIRR